jgi:TRAP-type C4-dicarboxylate transport system substrate-binding protein
VNRFSQKLVRGLMAGGVTAALALLTAPATAQAETVIKCGSVAPEGTPWEEWLKDVKKRVEAEGAGELKMKVYLGGKLGGEKEMIEDTKAGRLQMFGGSVGALASKYVPELNVFELPFLFKNDAEVDYVLDKLRPEVSKLLEKRGFVMGMWAENGWHGYAVKGKCVGKPEDMTGLKMRSQESKIHLETYKAFGASPVELPVPEVLSSLQTGVVDGFSNTPLFSFATSWYQGVDHYSYTKHIYQPAMIIYSKKWFDKLPAPQKAILKKTTEEKSGIASVRALTGPLLENFTHAGVKLCKVEDSGRAAYEAKAKSVWDVFAKQSKANKKMLDAVLKAKKDFASK